ncbi:MAG: LCP family protein [Lachnospiraceae bacterium]|jgi:LCP family protein required for cell wall assembly|uniref:LCP family protein n=1 Tax=Clostridia TaxID=186801 RepID=UPI000E4DD7DA|nr:MULTISPECIES: LCP family protein [Clostridia]MBS5191777.1 LCP family protein [Lachnospiraceae bacterium]RHV65061.1 LytR family transcriptional regulator [Roseburia sp. OM02-15]
MAKGKKISKKQRRKRKLILFIVEIIILIIVAGALYVYSKLNLFNRKELDQSKVGKNEVSKETQQTFEGNTTIALFGLDNRDQGVYDTGNSDVIMVMNINNDTKEVSLVSVYRDTYLNIAGEGEEEKFRKANAAYSAGGAEQAVTMLNRNLDLDIDNYVAFDFKSVAEAIDILGGVEIDIESQAEMDYLNDYISYTSEYVGGSDEMIDHLGKQTLNGVQAVSYARIRYTAGGDFKRAERQRRVLNELIKKAKDASLTELNELVSTIFPEVSTDLTQKDIISMMPVMLKYDMANSGGFPYDKTTDTPSKKIGSIVIPCDLESNVIQLHKQLFGTEDYQPSETVQSYNDTIIDLTGKTTKDSETDQFSDQDDFFGNGTQQNSNNSGDGGADSSASDSQ